MPPGVGSSRGYRGDQSSRLPPELLGGDAARNRDPILRRPADTATNPAVPDAGRSTFGRSGSSRGTMDLYRPGRGVNPAVPDVHSGFGSYGGRGRGEILPPPPPPIHGRLSNRYWRYVSRHYDHYSHRWFGGAHSWRTFVHSCSYSPWFWNHYNYVHSWPWCYGYYDPVTYVNCGWWTPRWYGRVYYPWWSWCDAPFVYFYYRYPARFSLSLNIGGLGFYYNDYGYYNNYYDDYYDSIDYDYGYTDFYDGGASIVMSAVDRPLGVWVPGHWEPQYVVDTEWVWVPGHYVY